MANERIHRAVSEDGPKIAGRVRGHGPPLVLVHGVLDDSDLDWGPAVPFLADRFTCHLPSTRGRGLSDDGGDHTRERLVQDVTAYVDSIGEPVFLVGHSLGGQLALGAAAQSAAVAAVAAYEPALVPLLNDEESALFKDAVARIGQAVAEDRLTEAEQIFVELVCNGDEVATLSESGYIEAAARYAPIMLEDIRQGARSQAPSPGDPSVLARITVPVLLLQGPRTVLRWFPDVVSHVARHVADPHVRDIAGAGHLGPILHPEPVAEKLARFFQAASQRA